MNIYTYSNIHTVFRLFRSKMLQMGSSKPWPDAMEVLTGQRVMDASGLLEYFKPLHDWLKVENERTGEYIGWKPSTVGKKRQFLNIMFLHLLVTRWRLFYITLECYQVTYYYDSTAS